MSQYRNPGNPNAGYFGQGGGYGGMQNPQLINQQQGQYTQDFFIYSATIAALTSLATSIQSFQIQADSDFEWAMTTVSANISTGTEPESDGVIIPITLTITDSGSGRQLTSSPIPLGGIAGTGKQPFILPVPRKFMAKSTVTLVFTSFSTNTWQNIYFNLIGRKIFRLGP